ncbi:hypothetical protein [Lentzea sp. NPDC003310]|uniref:hypothetical protein n=1 Tax=Lentzea sp. NPDC003310 TaxID=3154447 RepID=UPI0033BC7321
MSWLRRFLLLAGLVTGAWLLGTASEAHADVRVEIDQLKIEVELPVVDIGLEVETAPPPHRQPVPPKPQPRVEPPEAVPAVTPPAAPKTEAPVLAESPPEHRPAAPEPPAATAPVQEPEPSRPQAEQPVPGTLPQSGAGSGTSTQLPVGTLPHVPRPPATTASEVSTDQQDVPHNVRAEEPTFSPD